MRTMLLFSLALVVVGTAWADPDDLTGATFFAHTVPELPYSTDPPAAGWCGAYAPYAVCTPQQIDAQLAQGYATWYVLAAWMDEGRTWCGAEFGFADFDPEPFQFLEFRPCYPTTGLEISTPGWPGPVEGTAFVTTGEPWQGNWVPIYWFGGYAYGPSHGATVIMIGVYPPTALCGVSNCQNPPSSFWVDYPQRGGMGVNRPGVVAELGCVPPSGACCIPYPPYCCEVTWENECYAMGGTWLPDEECETADCPHPGACCLGGICELLFEENCILIGGTFMGVGTTCEPNPCEIHTPAKRTSWGRIKGLYR